MPIVIAQSWLESERGWGTRPHGVTLHKSVKDRDAYIEAHNAEFNNEKTVPDFYVRSTGNPMPVDVSDLFMRRLEQELNESRSTLGKLGWQITDEDFGLLQKTGEIDPPYLLLIGRVADPQPYHVDTGNHDAMFDKARDLSEALRPYGLMAFIKPTR